MPSNNFSLHQLHQQIPNIPMFPEIFPISPPTVSQRVEEQRETAESMPFKIGDRTSEYRPYIETKEFVHRRIGLRKEPDFSERARRCERKIVEMINIFLDYLKQNSAKLRVAPPPFPDEFHKLIIDITYKCLTKYRMNVNVIAVYDGIHEGIKKIEKCEKVDFRYLVIPVEVDQDKQFLNSPDYDSQYLKEFSERPF